ncbi:MAG: hypothetical protein RUDDFDWM_002033, partial [Candidatus Fervidibacterota bacterium]
KLVVDVIRTGGSVSCATVMEKQRMQAKVAITLECIASSPHSVMAKSTSKCSTAILRCLSLHRI